MHSRLLGGPIEPDVRSGWRRIEEKGARHGREMRSMVASANAGGGGGAAAAMAVTRRERCSSQG